MADVTTQETASDARAASSTVKATNPDLGAAQADKDTKIVEAQRKAQEKADLDESKKAAADANKRQSNPETSEAQKKQAEAQELIDAAVVGDRTSPYNAGPLEAPEDDYLPGGQLNQEIWEGLGNSDKDKAIKQVIRSIDSLPKFGRLDHTATFIVDTLHKAYAKS